MNIFFLQSTVGHKHFILNENHIYNLILQLRSNDLKDIQTDYITKEIRGSNNTVNIQTKTEHWSENLHVIKLKSTLYTFYGR